MWRRGLVRQSSREAVCILEELLGRIDRDGVDALLDGDDALLMMADREWRSEAAVEVGVAALRRSSENVVFRETHA